MTEQVLDVRRFLALLRRFWLLVLVFVVAGTAAGAALFLRSSSYRATSLVLLPSPASGSGATSPANNSITTDARIATSAAVLVPAGKKVDPSLSPAALEGRVSASAQASGVLAISASGAGARQAEVLANAVAEELVSFVTTSGSRANAKAVASLQAQAAALHGQQAAVAQQLAAARARLAGDNPSSPAAQQDATDVAALAARTADLALQIQSVTRQLSATAAGSGTTNVGTEVIQRATTASGPTVLFSVLVLAAGAAAGLLVGSVVVVAWRRNDRRLWAGDAMAEALGSPVVLALDAPARRAAGDWAALLVRYRPGSTEQWDVRRALRRLGGEGGPVSTLDILAFADDAAGLAQAVQVVLAVAVSGMETAFSLVADDGRAAALRAAYARWHDDAAGRRPRLEVRSGGPAEDGSAPDLAVTVQVVDRRDPVPKGGNGPRAVTVVSVSAGFASAEELARLAIAADDGGAPVQGVFVANPSADDRRPAPRPVMGAAVGLSRQGGTWDGADRQAGAGPDGDAWDGADRGAGVDRQVKGHTGGRAAPRATRSAGGGRGSAGRAPRVRQEDQ